MAHRHLMAVCVVCLLCAEHLPCKEHVLTPTKNDPERQQQRISLQDGSTVLTQVADIPDIYLYDKRKDKTKDSEVVRRKRHADHPVHHHHHHDETPEVTKAYIRKIFSRFTNHNTNTMGIDEFEKMMMALDLKYLGQDEKDNSSCMNRVKFLEKMTDMEEDHDHDQKTVQIHDHDHDHNEEDHSIREKIKIGADHVLAMCPILLYHIINRQTPLEDNGCINESYFKGGDIYPVDEEVEMEPREKVWLYSTLSIVGVSLCGLFGVAVIPIMEKHFYHHVLQFLVALAVGTLAGDALLHLLPHAMLPLGAPDEDIHLMMMMRGLAAVGGIVFFYFFERFLTMITEWRQRKQKRDKPSSRVRVMRDPESVSLNNGVTSCKHKYSSYPYCYDEIAMETKDDHHEHQHIENEVPFIHDKDIRIVSPIDGKKLNGVVSDHSIDPDNNTLSTSVDEGSIAENNTFYNNNKTVASIVSSKAKESVQEENYKIILREHQRNHHGHSHTHGHVHSPPGSLSAVVWMVIMGDGLHNFTDGMAIGAAFSNNIAGGLSTAVAVFCHELPHELGDFAVLLKAGMSAKQAVYYNILSSVLSFFGMCVGIWIGDTPQASQWIFAVAAGLFIYIALVDMMPELTSSHGKEENCMLHQCLLQFLGMTCGFSTMLLIAIYEHDLKGIFSA